MTERWRKKLEDLDKIGPTDNVFRRSKEGPTWSDDQLPRARTSTRIVTGVVAFAVFALALSAFAIPVLRMREVVPGDDGAPGMLPVWPAQTPDQLQQLQDAADNGDAGWALDPGQIAQRFGREVMGWPDVWITETGVTGCAYALDPETGTILGTAPCPSLPSDASVLSGSSSVSPSAIRITISNCDGTRDCAVGPLTEVLTILQPLGAGDGDIWAVLDARAPGSGLRIRVVPGQSVHEGATLSATTGNGDLAPTLGYQTCGTGAATSDFATTEGGYLEGQIRVDLPDGCFGPTAGDVWLALGSSNLKRNGSTTLDPLVDGVDGLLPYLTVIPIVALFPTSPVSTSGAQATASPSATGDWISYTDPLGFSLNLPSDWGTTSIPDELILNAPSGEPYIQINRVPNERFHDDSSFPLDYASMASDPQPHFYGDGQAFIIQWLTGSERPPTEEEAAIFDRITRSISFELWDEGETRNGWTAVGVFNRSATAKLYSVDGKDWFAWEGPPRTLYGPVLECPQGNPSYEVSGSNVTLTCPDGSVAAWDLHDGYPLAANAVGLDAPLSSHPALVAWDGSLIAMLGG